MNNYTTLIGQLKREIVNFSNKICKGLSKPEFKFVTDMFYGILECQEVHLSKIARALKENITLKKTIERLSRNLAELDDTEIITNNYIKNVKLDMTDRSILIIDDSDIAKPKSKVLESMCEIRDGSTEEITQGYHMLEMTALTPKHKMPIPVYSKIYSSKEEGFVSADEEVLKGLKYLSANFSKKEIRALDRGYDALCYYEYFFKNNEKFVIRAKKNRYVVHDGKTVNIMELAKKYKGKYKMQFKGKNGKKIEIKISIVPVKLYKYPKKEINLVIVQGFGKEPMLLLSNLNSTDDRLAEVITKVYLMRWRIEEYYKFKKQQFKFEDFRVRTLKSIRNLNMILVALIGMLGILSEKQNTSKLAMEIIDSSKRIYGKKKFVYYAIADGIYEILSKSTLEIRRLLSPISPPILGQTSIAAVTG